MVCSVGKPGRSLEAITTCLELRGFLGCSTLVLTPEKSCAKAGQVGPPTSFQPSQHLVQVQRGIAGGERASGLSPPRTCQRHGREDQGTSVFSSLMAALGEREELLQGTPGVGARPMGHVEGESGTRKRHRGVENV